MQLDNQAQLIPHGTPLMLANVTLADTLVDECPKMYYICMYRCGFNIFLKDADRQKVVKVKILHECLSALELLPTRRGKAASDSAAVTTLRAYVLPDCEVI